MRAVAIPGMDKHAAMTAILGRISNHIATIQFLMLPKLCILIGDAPMGANISFLGYEQISAITMALVFKGQPYPTVLFLCIHFALQVFLYMM